MDSVNSAVIHTKLEGMSTNSEVGTTNSEVGSTKYYEKCHTSDLHKAVVNKLQMLKIKHKCPVTLLVLIVKCST